MNAKRYIHTNLYDVRVMESKLKKKVRVKYPLSKNYQFLSKNKFSDNHKTSRDDDNSEKITTMHLNFEEILCKRLFHQVEGV